MNSISQHKFFPGVVLGLILILAFFVRIYNFHDWQYFKMDQGRDAQLVSHAINEGAGMLPLLGPRAGATAVDNGFLRLGPAYYYFQYLSGKIFNSTDPQVFAYPDLFFSLLAIVLLYFFAGLYFSKNTSLLIATMYAFSFIIIEYSRFAWNPNALQFFVLLAFFGLLKFFSAQNTKSALGWIAVWALALAIGSQLHFFGFFVLLGVSGLFILIRSEFWKKEKREIFYSKKFFTQLALYAVVFVAVFGLIYTPVIISDVMRKGENSKNFVQALSSKPTNKPFITKVVKNFSENTKYYCLITTAFCTAGDATDSPLSAGLTLVLFIGGITLAIRATKKEQKRARKDFLLLLFVWMSVFFILTIPVSFQLRPRFFILVFAVPFILTGLIFDFFRERWLKKSAYLVAVICMIILGTNIFGTLSWFSEQEKSQTTDTKIARTLILKNKDGVTRGELQKAVDFIYAQRQGKNALFYYVKPEHVQPIKYLLSQKKDPILNYATLNAVPSSRPNAQFFAIIPSGTDTASLNKKFENDFQVVASQPAGQITAYELVFPSRVIDLAFQEKVESSGPNDRLFWQDVFGRKADNASQEVLDESESEDGP
ncbi:MAG: phospholipid carrier-dependent glycosyltransferase [Candidatus Moraniibacteriota bacterium]